jgi:hypothetical protein
MRSQARIFDGMSFTADFSSKIGFVLAPTTTTQTATFSPMTLGLDSKYFDATLRKGLEGMVLPRSFPFKMSDDNLVESVRWMCPEVHYKRPLGLCFADEIQRYHNINAYQLRDAGFDGISTYGNQR